MSQRVLIVEDEVLIALDLSYNLEALGHEVVATAADAAEALEAAAQGIDLALVDLNLRDGLTGPRLGEALARKWGAAVIYLTATPYQIGPGITGPVGILSKPFTDAALAQAVGFAISLRAGRSAIPPSELRLLSGAAAAVQGARREACL
jgi:CheY-like chemotaxis protein